MKFLLILLTFFSTLIATASIELLDVTNASVFLTDTNGANKVFGGTSGTCAAGTGTSTCDSCIEAAGLTSCNPRMISSSTVLTIQFKVTSDISTTGRVRLFEAQGTEVTNISNASTGVTKGDTASFEVTWGELCSHMASALGDCSVSESETFTVGIDVDENGLGDSESGTIFFQVHAAAADTVTTCNDGGNTDGVCFFSANPGDKKVVIEDVATEGSFPTPTGVAFTHIRIYYTETNFPTTPNDPFEDLPINQDSDGFFLGDKIISGLSNNIPYFFRSATVDQAGNVAYFLHDDAITSACGASPGAADDLNCPFIASPAEVFGLLTEDVNCFIATAAFGSLWHRKVNDLRLFRDQFLKPYYWGQRAVDTYYEYGPIAAKSIQHNETARALVRSALFPFWIFARVAVDYGFSVALLLTIALLIINIRILQLYRQRRLGVRV